MSGRSNHSYSRGNVLIMVLVFSMIMSLMAISIVETAFFQIKMVDNFKRRIKADQQAEKKILEMEDGLKDNVDLPSSDNLTLLQFVPDSLVFGEKEGINYYQVSFSPIMTTYSVRRKKSLPFMGIRCTQCDRDRVLFVNADGKRMWQWEPPSAVKLSEAAGGRDGMHYVLGSNHHLYSINEKGETESDTLLISDPQGTHLSKQGPLLSGMDILWDGYPQSVLVGVMARYPPQLVKIDTSFKKILWTVTLPRSKVLHSPIIARFSENHWAIVLLNFSEDPAENSLNFYDFNTGSKLKTRVFAHASQVVAVDRGGRDFCDLIFVQDNSGGLWKLDINFFENEIEKWQIIPSGYGKIIGKPLVGYHPLGQGFMIYLLVNKAGYYSPPTTCRGLSAASSASILDTAHKARYVGMRADTKAELFDSELIALELSETRGGRTAFRINLNQPLSQPILRQDYLIVGDLNENHIPVLKVYNAFDGKQVSETALTLNESQTAGCANPDLLPPFIEKDSPKESAYEVMVKVGDQIAFTRAELDYKKQGRKTWESMRTPNQSDQK